MIENSWKGPSTTRKSTKFLYFSLVYQFSALACSSSSRKSSLRQSKRDKYSGKHLPSFQTKTSWSSSSRDSKIFRTSCRHSGAKSPNPGQSLNFPDSDKREKSEDFRSKSWKNNQTTGWSSAQDGSRNSKIDTGPWMSVGRNYGHWGTAWEEIDNRSD